jgi:hypothetical protein
MSEKPTETTSLTDENQKISDHSTLFGVSIRGWVALILVVTVCVMGFLNIEVREPLYSLVLTVSSFYFGHQIAVRSKNGG